jgi:hypothetical protein
VLPTFALSGIDKRLVETIDYVQKVPSATYCITVADNANMCMGVGDSSIICSNCDDPHNTESVESEAERQSVLGWWKELSTTRLNDPKRAAIVVIMQRLHEEDVSGTILASDEEWTHYCVPMKYDPARHCSTMLGWNDPRGVDEDGEPLVNLLSRLPKDQNAARVLMQERAGALMWPERFGAEEVAKIERGLAGRVWRVAGCSKCQCLKRVGYSKEIGGKYGNIPRANSLDANTWWPPSMVPSLRKKRTIPVP